MDKRILRVSIVIPTRNRARSLSDTLVSINCGDCLPQQIIIVDQSDMPLSRPLLQSLVDSRVLLEVLYVTKPSLTRARNKGASAAIGEILAFMDDDVLLNAESLCRLSEAFWDDRIAFVGSMHPADTPRPKRYPEILGLLFARKKLGKQEGYVCEGAMLGRYPSRVSSVVDTEWGMGFFFAVRKALFDEFGVLFDENLISYAFSEDLDFTYTFCRKARSQGYRTVLDPKIYVNHLGSREWRVPKREETYMYVIHRLYLSYKHFSNPLYRLVLLWSDIGEILRRMVAKEDVASIVKAYAVSLKYGPQFKRGMFPSELHKYIRPGVKDTGSAGFEEAKGGLPRDG